MLSASSRIFAFLVLFLCLAGPVQAQSALDELFNKAIEQLSQGDGSGERVRVPVSRAEIQLSFAPLVKKVAPAVVNVYAARKVVQRSPFAGDPFFERFFGGGFGNRQPRNQSSLGSGVIVSQEGMVVTNHHVIKDADEVKIALADGREFEAKIILKDEQSDLAVLKVTNGGSFPAIEIGDSDTAEVGDLVLAIGNPFGVGQTVTSGIISAVARSRVGISDFGFFLQTDAAINPGNSGGALVDMQGKLIGINTAIYSRSGGSNGIGFAIPSNMVEVVLRSSETGDRVTRPWIGASFQEVTSDIANSIGLNQPRGALVTSIYPGGPADKAGIRPGDVVLAVNGDRIPHLNALDYRLTTVGIGNVAEIRVLSRGKRDTRKVSLMPAPETVPANETVMPPQSGLGGALVANLSPALSQQIKLPVDKTGVVVLQVQRNSYAAANRIRPGDIIRNVNGFPIENVGSLQSVMNMETRKWVITVERQGREYIFERNGGFFRQYVQ